METSLLQNEWSACVKALGIQDIERSQDVFRGLMDRYHEEHRANRTWSRIAEVMSAYNEFAHLSLTKAENRLAIFYIDAIFDPREKDSENKNASAALAAKELGELGIGPTTIAIVEQRICATKHRGGLTNYNDQLAADADLSPLGAGWERFKADAAAIRLEYEHLPEAVFRKERLAFLQNLWERGDIFYTQPMRKKYQDQARRNLLNAINELT